MGFKEPLDKVISSVNLYKIYSETVLCTWEYTIVCCVENSAYVQTEYEEKCKKLLPNDVFFLPPGTKAVLSPDSSAICMIFEFVPVFLLRTIDLEVLWKVTFLNSQNIPAKGIMRDLFWMAYKYLAERDGSEYQIISYVYSFLQKLKDTFSPNPPAEEKEANAKNVSCKCDNIEHFIDGHVHEAVRLKDAAKEIGVTPQYLSSYVQKTYGCTFLNYVNRYKAKKSIKWLVFTALSDEEITSFFSFKDISSFRKYIFEVTGRTSDEIRRERSRDHNPVKIDPALSVPVQPYFERYISNVESVDHALRQMRDDKQVFTFAYTDTRGLSQSWKFILNVGYAYRMNDPRIRMQIQTIQKEIKFCYARICRPLDLVEEHNRNGKIIHNFESIFRLLDYIQKLELIPFLEVGYKDAKIHTNFIETYIVSQRQEIEEYLNRIARIFPAFMRACCNRYGKEKVKEWKISVYYDFVGEQEEMNNLTFWKYISYYNQICKTVKEYVPECKVGGMDFNVYVPVSNLKSKLEILKSKNIDLGFVCITVYGAINSGYDTHLSLDPEYTIKKTIEVVKVIRTIYPKLPIYVSEFSFCYTSRNYLNDTVFQSCYVVQYLCRIMKYVQGMGYFTLSDISVRYSDSDEMFFGGNGIFNYAGIRKPVFYSFSFMEELGNKLIGQTKNFIITAKSRYSFQGIFYHYVHVNKKGAYSERNEQLLTAPEQIYEYSSPKVLEVHIGNVLSGRYLFKTYTLDQCSGNVFQQWAKCQSLCRLKEMDLKFFNRISYPKTTLYTQAADEDGVLNFTVRLYPEEVTLILIDFLE